MGVTRKIIKWCDNKYNEALLEEDNRKAGTKAFVSGCVEGFADAAIVLYPVVVIACHIWKYKATKQ